MNLLLAFAAISLLALVVLVTVDGYAKHLGDPEPTDWKAIFLIAAGIGLVGAGLGGVAVELLRSISFVWSLLT